MSPLRFRTRKRLVALAALAITVYVFWDMTSESLKYGTTASGLVTLAMNGENHSYNPFSRDASFISPATAEWMLTRFDWPYDETLQPSFVCDTPQSHIHQVISARAMYGPDSQPDPRMLRLLERFLERGLPMEQRYCGYTPLLNAVLFADFEAVQALLDAGADPSAKARRPGRKSDGWTSLELATYLDTQQPGDYTALVELLADLDES